MHLYCWAPLEAFGAQLLVIYLLGHAVLAPGEITKHRVVGAVALYLSLGMAFTGAYRLASELAPGSLANVPPESDQFRSRPWRNASYGAGDA